LKKYPAKMRPNPVHGDMLQILFPDSIHPIEILQDVFGEQETLCQVLVYEPSQEEPALAIRFNDDGTIAEISLPKKYRALIVKAEAHTASPWMIRRDGV